MAGSSLEIKYVALEPSDRLESSPPPGLPSHCIGERNSCLQYETFFLVLVCTAESSQPTIRLHFLRPVFLLERVFVYLYIEIELRVPEFWVLLKKVDLFRKLIYCKWDYSELRESFGSYHKLIL